MKPVATVALSREHHDLPSVCRMVSNQDVTCLRHFADPLPSDDFILIGVRASDGWCKPIVVVRSEAECDGRRVRLQKTSCSRPRSSRVCVDRVATDMYIFGVSTWFEGDT